MNAICVLEKTGSLKLCRFSRKLWKYLTKHTLLFSMQMYVFFYFRLFYNNVRSGLSALLSLGDGRPFPCCALIMEILVAACIHVDMDMDMDGKFHIHG